MNQQPSTQFDYDYRAEYLHSVHVYWAGPVKVTLLVNPHGLRYTVACPVREY